MSDRMQQTGGIPVAGSGVAGWLQKRMGLPGYSGSYTPAQFKEPAYGGETPLRAEVRAADQYRQSKNLPALDYERVWKPVPLFQSSNLNSNVGMAVHNDDGQPNVFMGQTMPARWEGGNWTMPYPASQIDPIMQRGSAPAGILAKLLPAQHQRDYASLGALARHFGIPQTAGNLSDIRDKVMSNAISGGSASDDVRDPAGVLEHELGHTWIGQPQMDFSDMVKIRPSPIAPDDWAGLELQSDSAREALRQYILRSQGNRAGLPTTMHTLQAHDAHLPELLNYGSALQQHMFKTRGARLKSPEEVQNWMQQLLGAPDEPTFENALKSYPFDVRRMMRHNWRLQQGSGLPEKANMLRNLQDRMKLWFPALVHNTPLPTQTKTAALGAVTKALKYMARVPANKPFAPTLGSGIRNTLKVGFNPYLGRYGHWPKRGLQVAGLGMAGNAYLNARHQVTDTASQVSSLIPSIPVTADAKQYVGRWAQAPELEAAKLLWNGRPEQVPEPQWNLLTDLAGMWIRHKLHSMQAGWPSWLKLPYAPAAPVAGAALRTGAQQLVRPVNLADLLQTSTHLRDAALHATLPAH